MNKWDTASFSKIGKRENNEDSWAIHHLSADTTLLMVCDGVGGNIGGEIASKLVCKDFLNYLLRYPTPHYSLKYLQDAINYCQESLVQYVHANPECEAMATTLVFCLISLNKGVWVGHVGDSRFYHLHFRNDLYKIKHVTIDHNLTGPSVAAGIISELEARLNPQSNTLTRCLSGSKDFRARADIFEIKKLNKGDILFLCSDGVIESFTSNELSLVFSSQQNFKEKFRNIENTCELNSSDNYTAVAAIIGEKIKAPYSLKRLFLLVILPVTLLITLLITVYFLTRPSAEESLIKDSILDSASHKTSE